MTNDSKAHKIWKIVTIGDSLTEGNGRGSILSTEPHMPNTYQHYLYHRLRKLGIECEVHNFGIGGEVISQICARFPTTVPADIIVTMGGTNDTWRFSDTVAGVETEMAEDIISQYAPTIEGVMQKQEAMGKGKPIIIVNSIPPVGNVSTIPKNMWNCINIVNQELRKFVEASPAFVTGHLQFCDVHSAMAQADKYMRQGLSVPDGVHFTTEGNRACGEAVADFIAQMLRNMLKN